MPKKIGKSVLKRVPKPKVRRRNVYVPYYSDEFRDVVRYIQTKLKKRVYLIGLRALYERGVPAYRLTEDFDIYAPMTKEERNDIIKHVRKRYESSKERWTDFGFTLDFDPIGHVDVNIAPLKVYDNSWDKEAVEINDVIVYLPPIEDLLVLKLLSPRRLDRKDVGVALLHARDKIDFDRLKTKAQKVGVEKKLVKIAKRYGVRLGS